MTQIPAGWKETTLGDILILNYGKALTLEKRKNGIIPVYGSSGITGYHNQELVGGPGIIIGRKGSVGKVYFSKQSFYPIDTVYYILPDKNYDLIFIYNLLLTLGLDKMNSDSAVPGLNRDNAYAIPIHLPPLPEQQAIAAVLSSFDDKIELLRAENQTLEQMGQELFKERFVKPTKAPHPPKGGDSISAQAPAKGGADITSQQSASGVLGAEGKSPSGDLGASLPEGWRVGKLGEMVEITTGKRPSEISDTKNSLFQIPLIGATKIMGYVQNFLFDGETLVIGRVGTHGEVQMFYEKIHPSDNTLVFKSTNFYFTYFTLKSIDYEKMNRGAVQPLITQSDLKNYDILIPDQETLSQFDLVIKPLFNKIRTNSEQIISLSATRDQILPKLMSGEVRVKF